MIYKPRASPGFFLFLAWRAYGRIRALLLSSTLATAAGKRSHWFQLTLKEDCFTLLHRTSIPTATTSRRVDPYHASLDETRIAAAPGLGRAFIDTYGTGEGRHFPARANMRSRIQSETERSGPADGTATGPGPTLLVEKVLSCGNI